MHYFPILEMLQDSAEPSCIGSEWEKEETETIPVFLDVEQGNLRAVKQYLLAGGDVNAVNAQGQTLLAAAVRYSWPKIASLLLEHGANPDLPDVNGRTPLHHAAARSVDCTKLLVRAGANIKARDDSGKSVLRGWWYELDQWLRAHGAED